MSTTASTTTTANPQAQAQAQAAAAAGTGNNGVVATAQPVGVVPQAYTTAYAAAPNTALNAVQGTAGINATPATTYFQVPAVDDMGNDAVQNISLEEMKKALQTVLGKKDKKRLNKGKFSNEKILELYKLHFKPVRTGINISQLPASSLEALSKQMPNAKITASGELIATATQLRNFLKGYGKNSNIDDPAALKEGLTDLFKPMKIKVPRQIKDKDGKVTKVEYDDAEICKFHVMQTLKDMGFGGKEVRKASEKNLLEVFDKMVKTISEPGKHKFKIKLGGKKFKVDAKVDAFGKLTSLSVKKDAGFWGSIMKFLPIILAVVGFACGGILGVLATVANSALSVYNGVKSGNILGIVAGIAGGVGGLAAGLGSAAFGTAASAVSKVSSFVSKGASAIDSFRSGSPAGILGGLAGVAGGAAGALGSGLSSTASALNTASTWLGRGANAAWAVGAAKNGDWGGALQAGWASGSSLIKSDTAVGKFINEKANPWLQRGFAGYNTFQAFESGNTAAGAMGAYGLAGNLAQGTVVGNYFNKANPYVQVGIGGYNTAMAINSGNNLAAAQNALRTTGAALSTPLVGSTGFGQSLNQWLAARQTAAAASAPAQAAPAAAPVPIRG